MCGHCVYCIVCCSHCIIMSLTVPSAIVDSDSVQAGLSSQTTFEYMNFVAAINGRSGRERCRGLAR